MANRISRGSEIVQVEPKVMHVLCCLAERPGRTVTKEQFMARVWEDTVVTNDVLARCISELRKVLGDDWREPEYVETIRKTGYRLIAPVRARADWSAAEGDLRTRAPRWRFVRRAMQDVPLRWAASILVVLLALGGGLLWGLGAAESDPPAPPSTTPLTSFRGREVDPALSPDGMRIAFGWDGGAGDHQNLYIKQLGAETPLRITDVSADEWSPSWSPDGRFLAFARRTGERYDIFIAPAIGGTVRNVVTTGYREIHSLDWSPDTSRQALIVSARTAPHHAFGLYLLPLDQDSLLQLTDPPSHAIGDTHPVFSLDGSTVAFARGVVEEAQDVHVLSLDEGTERPVGFDDASVRGITWAEDGDLIVAATTSAGSRLWRVPPSRSRKAEWILTASEGNVLENPTLAANEPRLAYVQRTINTNIWEIARAAGYRAYSARPILASTRWDGYPDISSTDTALIAFASRRSGFMEIWKAESDGSQPLQLTSFESQSYSPRWSPDGTRLVFVSRHDGDADVYVMDSEGRSVRQLTTVGSEDMLPNWSTDGSMIYFTSDRSGTWQTWRVHIAGGPPEQLTWDGALEAQEAADGSALYVLRPDTSGIWRRPIMKPAIASALPVFQTASLQALDAPDEKARSAAPRDSILHEPYTLVIPGVDPADAGSWKVTPHGVYYVRRSTQSPELVRFDPSSRRVIRIATLDQVPSRPTLGVGASEDRFLYTQLDRDESDVVLLEPFP